MERVCFQKSGESGLKVWEYGSMGVWEYGSLKYSIFENGTILLISLPHSHTPILSHLLL
jgi:hypothetical protein